MPEFAKQTRRLSSTCESKWMSALQKCVVMNTFGVKKSRALMIFFSTRFSFSTGTYDVFLSE